eukprot:2977333-Rhodomonas_salina.1
MVLPLGRLWAVHPGPLSAYARVLCGACSLRMCPVLRWPSIATCLRAWSTLSSTEVACGMVLQTEKDEMWREHK